MKRALSVALGGVMGLNSVVAAALPPNLREQIESAASPPVPVEVPASPSTQPAEPLAPEPPPPGPYLFGTSAIALRDGTQDQRWKRIGALPSRNPLLAALVRQASRLSRYEQASFVQATINGKLIYRLDQDNWGVRDYWASADETIARGAGDCEDLALVKLQALRLLGFNDGDLYFMVGSKPSRQDHALLLVRIDGRFWVLEDGLTRMIPAESFRMFHPGVTYGATGWRWLHGEQRSAAPTQAPGVAVALP